MVESIVRVSLSLLLLQGALSSSVDSQCPVGDSTCRASPDVSEFLQSRVKVSQLSDNDEDRKDGDRYTKAIDALEGNLSNCGWWDDAVDTVSDTYDSAKKKVEDTYKKAKKGIVELVDDAGELIDDAGQKFEETYHAAKKETEQALIDVQKKATHWGTSTWNNLKKEYEAVKKEAEEFAKNLVDFGDCLDIAQLFFNIMFGDKEAAIDKDESTFDVVLSETPKLDTKLKTTLGGNDGLTWGYGPEQHGYVTVTAGANISFKPEIRLTLEPVAGTAKFQFSGEVQATMFADFTATASSKFTKVVRFSPQSVIGCAGVFCVNFMVQGVARLFMEAELAGHASAEVAASYSVSGMVDFNSKTGEAEAEIELGKLTHEETISYESTFKGRIELKAGPIFTVLPLPGVPITFEPFAKVELKAYAQANGGLSNGNKPKCNEKCSGSGCVNYRGCQSRAKSGDTCQRWTSQNPHSHTATASNFPNKGLGDHNFCRNPDGEPSIWCYTINPNKRWSFCDPVCPHSERLKGTKGAAYRGCQSKTRSGRTCQKWTSQKPHKHTRTASRFPGKYLGDHNYCRNPDGEPTIWCYTNQANKRWEYCNPRPTSLLEHNVTDSEDAIAFWQSKVEVAKEDDVDLMETQPSDGGSTQAHNACGKAGLNIRAGAEITFLGFPFPDFDTAALKKMILEELAKVPTKSTAEVSKMIGKCAGIPGIDSAVSALDDVTKEAASFIADAIPDFKVTFPKAQNLMKTDEACHSVWEDSLPKGQTCSNYNVGC